MKESSPSLTSHGAATTVPVWASIASMLAVNGSQQGTTNAVPRSSMRRSFLRWTLTNSLSTPSIIDALHPRPGPASGPWPLLPSGPSEGCRCGGRGRPGPTARYGFPVSTTSPSSITRIRSAFRTVERRCATTNVVRPFTTSVRALCIWYSVSMSTLEVESSRISIGGSSRIVRAIARRCRWPPDSLTPRSPTHVS